MPHGSSPHTPRAFLTWGVSLAVLLGAAYMASGQIDLDALTPSFLVGKSCRCFPGDECWPSLQTWREFNKTLGGKLIATVSIASTCHDGFEGVAFDATECARVRDNWALPEFHVESTHSTMAAFHANESCDPFNERAAPCVIGTYVVYAVAATEVVDYQATLAFARRHNIRLVIRNTGHDYLGKSTGAGSLALGTHNVKGHSIIDYESSAYTGKAMKMGAGTLASEAQDAANTHGYAVVEGDCPTVGIAGGYIQGGGSSPLASRFGLAADQVLEWEVVTADGRLLTATPMENSELYWALAGGGGGTYGAVLSVTIKLHPNMQTAGAALSFTEQSDGYCGIFQTFLTNLPNVVDAGGTVFWVALPGNVLAAPQIYLPDGTSGQIKKLLEPTFDALEQAGVPYQFVAKDYDNFQDAYRTLNYQMNVTEMDIGGRLIPRSLVESPSSATQLTDTVKYIIDAGAMFAGVSLNVSKDPTSANSVLPAWRETLFLAFYGIPYDRTNYQFNIAARQKVTQVLGPAIETITPNGGAYLNEADVNQSNWQRTFYGNNYAKLVGIKRKYDPDGLFWGPTTVGSERWEVTDSGRLCRA